MRFPVRAIVPCVLDSWLVRSDQLVEAFEPVALVDDGLGLMTLSAHTSGRVHFVAIEGQDLTDGQIVFEVVKSGQPPRPGPLRRVPLQKVDPPPPPPVVKRATVKDCLVSDLGFDDVLLSDSRSLNRTVYGLPWQIEMYVQLPKYLREKRGIRISQADLSRLMFQMLLELEPDQLVERVSRGRAS